MGGSKNVGGVGGLLGEWAVDVGQEDAGEGA